MAREVAERQFAIELSDAGDGARNDHAFLIPHLPFSREVVLVVTVCSAQALVQASLAQGILPDGVIARSFGVGKADSTWGPAAYALTSGQEGSFTNLKTADTDATLIGTFMLPAGRIGDMYGHRRCFIGAYVWFSFSFSSLMTGLSVYSRSFIFYSVCRGLQGVASAMLVPCALAILGSIYKEGPRKNLVFSFYAAGSPVGFTIGSIFSALLAQLAWWPWMFYLTAIVCCGLGVISFFAIPKLPADLYREERQDSSTGKSWRKDFDWLGGLTGLAGLVLFNVAWNRAPAAGWNAPDVIVTLILGTTLFVTFLFVEHKQKQPLIPVNKLSKEAALVLATTALGWSSFGVLIFYLINFTLNLRGDSLLGTAAQIVPVPFAGFAASYLNSFLLSRGLLPADILAFSLIWFTLGSVLLATMPVDQIYWKQAFWIYVLSPFGMDLSFPSATLVMSQLVPPDRQGIAASLVATVVYYSQSIGLGIAGTVQVHVAGADTLRGYCGAFYTGIGLSCFGFLTALGPVIERRWKKQR